MDAVAQHIPVRDHVGDRGFCFGLGIRRDRNRAGHWFIGGGHGVGITVNSTVFRNKILAAHAHSLPSAPGRLDFKRPVFSARYPGRNDPRRKEARSFYGNFI